MKRNAQLSGNIHQRAIDLSDYLDTKGDFNRDQRIAAIRNWLTRENALGHQRGWNAARKAAK
jgi:hypothetical protein